MRATVISGYCQAAWQYGYDLLQQLRNSARLLEDASRAMECRQLLHAFAQPVHKPFPVVCGWPYHTKRVCQYMVIK